MSRIERKKIEKKSKIYMKVYLFLMIILLIVGLIAVDFEVRDMLAIDESSLIGYKQLENNQYIIQIMGENHLMDTLEIQNKMNNKFAELEEIAYNIKKWIENKY